MPFSGFQCACFALNGKVLFSFIWLPTLVRVKLMRWNDRIGRRIKLSDLHILLAVAQSGSMAKAANELAVSNPVVSRAISDLEHVLGVRLLDRGPHGVELTEYGLALLNRSHAAF